MSGSEPPGGERLIEAEEKWKTPLPPLRGDLPSARRGVPNGLVTDAGVMELVALMNLTTLDLGHCEKVTDVGVEELPALKSLSSLDSSGCVKVADAGLKHAAALRKLTSLDMNYTPVTDAGMKELAALKNLATLLLSVRKKVTDAGLKEPAGINTLTELDFRSCGKTTGEGLRTLRESLPKCKLHFQ